MVYLLILKYLGNFIANFFENMFIKFKYWFEIVLDIYLRLIETIWVFETRSIFGFNSKLKQIIYIMKISIFLITATLAKFFFSKIIICLVVCKALIVI